MDLSRVVRFVKSACAVRNEDSRNEDSRYEIGHVHDENEIALKLRSTVKYILVFS